MTAHDEQRISFATSDGLTIVGDLVVPDACVAAAIICHPHPQFGGNRFNPVVESLHEALPNTGVASLRFDFRADFDDGVGERFDAQGALAELRRRVPTAPLLACGYSFGALIALALDDSDLAGRVLIAPPLGHLDDGPELDVPTLVLTPEHDQFAPPAVAGPIVETWSNTEFAVIEMADHFVAGRIGAVAARASDWISGRWPLRSPL